VALSAVRTNRARVTATAIMVAIALAVRAVFFKYQTGDYATFYGWYEFIKQHGGFGALQYNFSNYNEPYLYLLALVTYLPVPALAGIKLISVSFDLLLAFFTFKVVRQRYPQGWAPLAASSLVLFLPTVVLNSSWWGQVDATYTAFALGGIYFVLRRKGWWACALFGLALAFKLQAVFMFPFVLLLAFRHRLRWRELLAIPAVFVVADMPALVLGAPISSLWSAYTGQVSQYPQLTLNAPNIYQYFDVATSSTLRLAGIAGALAAVVVLGALVVVRRVDLTPAHIVLAATVSVIVVPFLLPAMHERYFYMADILTVVSAFYLPRKLWALPVLEQFASLFSYMPFLLATTTTAQAKPFPGIQPAGTALGGAPLRGSSGAGRSTFSGGGGPNGFFGLPDHTIVSFPVLSSVMLAALLLALWAAASSMRRNKMSSQLVHSPQARHSLAPIGRSQYADNH